VKLYRTDKREGLIRARVIGAEHATGEVVVILDAHCECVVNWLPPLLTRIKVNRYILIFLSKFEKNKINESLKLKKKKNISCTNSRRNRME